MMKTTFAEEVKALPGGEALEMCYSCGTCTSQCMVQLKQEPEYNPRRLLRMVMMEIPDLSPGNNLAGAWYCAASKTKDGFYSTCGLY